MSLVVLLADGLRADTLRCAMDAGRAAALARLRESGGLHEVSTVFPSVTGPAYIPFLMGRFPGVVGVPGLRWYDRSRRACGFPDHARSYVGHQMNRVNDDIDPASPTIFECVPGSAGALSMVTRGLPGSRQLMALSLRSAVRAARTHFTGDMDEWLRVDEELSHKVVAWARDPASTYLFAAFMGIDKLSHSRLQDESTVRPALDILDETAARLLDVRERNPELRVWVASDHGHSPVHQHDDLKAALDAAGYRAVAHPFAFRPGAQVAVMVSGNAMAHLYVDLARRDRPFWAALEPSWSALAAWLLSRPSVDLVLVPLDTTRCAVWSSDRGRALVTCAGNRFSYDAGDGDPLGVGRSLHHACAAEAHDATWHSDYPDSIVQVAAIAASPRAGDFVVSARRGWDFRERFEPIPHRSSHGAMHRDHMLVPLLLDQPPSRRPRRTTDVMPSALRALGIDPPPGLDGAPF